jgi:hypothetical protein
MSAENDLEFSTRERGSETVRRHHTGGFHVVAVAFQRFEHQHGIIVRILRKQEAQGVPGHAVNWVREGFHSGKRCKPSGNKVGFGIDSPSRCHPDPVHSSERTTCHLGLTHVETRGSDLTRHKGEKSKSQSAKGTFQWKIDAYGRLAFVGTEIPLSSPPGEHLSLCTARAKKLRHHANT